MEPIRLGELLEQGDPQRRASHRLLVEGLEADARGSSARAKGRYDRALQLDPTNPYAYLVYARFEVARHRPGQARSFLDQAVALFEAQGGASPRVEPHIIGLEGAIASERGDKAQAAASLRRAGRLAPAVWGDAFLSAAELM